MAKLETASSDSDLLQTVVRSVLRPCRKQITAFVLMKMVCPQLLEQVGRLACNWTTAFKPHISCHLMLSTAPSSGESVFYPLLH
eukprot:COSAG02_NODE_526_length_20707_cov_11.431337_7_plen_84_part_00